MFRIQHTALNIALILAAGLWSGCGGSDTPAGPATGDGAPAAPSTPEAVALAFMEAGNAGDEAGFDALLTAAAREGLKGDGGFSLNAGQFSSIEVAEATIDGGEAEVPVTATNDDGAQTMNLKMRLETAGWRVWGVGVPMGDGASITMNFEEFGGALEGMAEAIGEAFVDGMEEAFASAFTGGTPEDLALEKESFDALAALTLGDYEAAWKIDVDTRGVTAGEALEAVLAPAGLIVHTGEHADLLARPVAIDLEGVSRMEAAVAIAREVGLHPIFPRPGFGANDWANSMASAMAQGLGRAMGIEGDLTGAAASQPAAKPAPNAVTFEAGDLAWPAAYAGPFRIRVEGLEENVPHGTGDLKLEIEGIGLPKPVRTMLAEAMTMVEMDEITDAQGRNLNADEGVTFHTSPQLEGPVVRDGLSIDLKNLIREVETIDRITGKLIVPRLGEVRHVKFDAMEPGETRTAGGFTIEITKTGTYTQFDITGGDAALEDARVIFQPLDAGGARMGVAASSAFAYGGKLQASVNTYEEPAAMELKIVGGAEPIEYPFEIAGVPLAHYAEMPERIEALSFEGHAAPMSVEFGGFLDRDADFPKVELRLVNHSNKAATSVRADFVYLDAGGEELKDFPHTVGGMFGPDGMMPVVEAGAEATVETFAFFMPEGTATVRVRLTGLSFIDATEWEAEGKP